MPNFFSIAHVDNHCFTYAFSRNAFVSPVVISALYQTKLTTSMGTNSNSKRKADVRIGVNVWQGRCEEKRVAHLFAACKNSASSDIFRKLLDRCRNRHGKKNPEKAGKLCPDYERENNEERWHSHDTRNYKWVDEVILELLGDDIERRCEKPQGHTPIDQSNSDRRHGRKNGAKNRNDLKHGRDDGEKEHDAEAH